MQAVNGAHKHVSNKAAPLTFPHSNGGRIKEGGGLSRTAYLKTALVGILLCCSLPAKALDHTYANYDSVLSKYVANGRVDYAGLRQDRTYLDAFLRECAAVTFDEYASFTKEQQLAFMINFYNAAVLQLVCDRPNLKSIDEFKGIFRDVWSLKFVRLFDHTVSLGQVLHDILRSEFKDLRIHFALATACKSDPKLLNTPYRAEILRLQLDQQMDEFMLSRPDANRFAGGTLFLSPKFKWYAVDFGKRADLIRFAARYFPEVNDETRVQFTPFDWSLNER